MLNMHEDTMTNKISTDPAFMKLQSKIMNWLCRCCYVQKLLITIHGHSMFFYITIDDKFSSCVSYKLFEDKLLCSALSTGEKRLVIGIPSFIELFHVSLW